MCEFCANIKKRRRPAVIKASAEEFIHSVDGLCSVKLPRWHELPDLDIYMDQVLSLISRYFRDFPGFSEKGLTSSMVNNYVKLGIIPAPEKKKYNRVHLAYLVIICILKTVMPITMIRDMISSMVIDKESYETLYNRFCEHFENVVDNARKTVDEMLARESSPTDLAILSALRSHTEQAIALQLIRSLTAEKTAEV